MTTKRFFALALLALPLIYTQQLAYAQQSVKASPEGSAGNDAAASIERLTHEVLNAELHSDVAAMERLFTANYSHTHQSGLVQNKAEFIASFKPSEQHYKIAEISDYKVRHFGTSAIINGRENINDHHYLFFSVWVQEQGTWKMAAWVTSPGPKAPEAH